MPLTPAKMEKLIMSDGWFYVRSHGSHRQYKHKTKPGTVTIPFHSRELQKATEQKILKQAGLK